MYMYTCIYACTCTCTQKALIEYLENFYEFILHMLNDKWAKSHSYKTTRLRSVNDEGSFTLKTVPYLQCLMVSCVTLGLSS